MGQNAEKFEFFFSIKNGRIEKKNVCKRCKFTLQLFEKLRKLKFYLFRVGQAFGQILS